MSFWDANSDLDWYASVNGPYPETVERTCRDCGATVRVVVEGEYQMHVLCRVCDHRVRNRQAKAEQEHEKPIKRGVA